MVRGGDDHRGNTVSDEWKRGHRAYHVPEKDLVGAAQTANQRPKLAVAEGLPEAGTPTNELRTFAVTLTASANATVSHPDGERDDLALATALAPRGARRRPAYGSVWNHRLGRWAAPPR